MDALFQEESCGALVIEGCFFGDLVTAGPLAGAFLGGRLAELRLFSTVLSPKGFDQPSVSGGPCLAGFFGEGSFCAELGMLNELEEELDSKLFTEGGFLTGLALDSIDFIETWELRLFSGCCG